MEQWLGQDLRTNRTGHGYDVSLKGGENALQTHSKLLSVVRILNTNENNTVKVYIL